jgi:hypothetical protein
MVTCSIPRLQRRIALNVSDNRRDRFAPIAGAGSPDHQPRIALELIAARAVGKQLSPVTRTGGEPAEIDEPVANAEIG